MKKTSFIAVMFCSVGLVFGQGVFFREHWLVYDPIINNNPLEKHSRANDPDLTLHEKFGMRPDGQQNGLVLVNVPENLFQLESAAVYLELWGGHPGVANKRFSLNGKGQYAIPERGTLENNCVYSYPLMPIKLSHLVPGVNAVQFSVDRGKSFWGNMIIDEAAIRCCLKPDHPDLVRTGLKGLIAEVQVPAVYLSDQTELSIAFSGISLDSIATVEYYGRYLGYDEESNFIDNDWHGYTYEKKPRGHIGTAEKPPFKLTWDTRWIPDQGQPMAVKARINFKNGISYFTPVRDGLLFPKSRKHVMLFPCFDLPHPFWVRASKGQKAHFQLPPSLNDVDGARLIVRIWDGGEGTIKDPFTINGHNYPITSGKANHRLVFTDCPVELVHLQPGINEIRLLSDTEHHGIEVLLPGPVLLVRFK